MIDLSKQRDGHKTSHASTARLSPHCARAQLTPILDRYYQIFTCEFGGDAAYIFHPPQSGFDRPMEGSAWSQWVGRLCSSGTPTSPHRTQDAALDLHHLARARAAAPRRRLGDGRVDAPADAAGGGSP